MDKATNNIRNMFSLIQSGWEMARLAWRSQPLCFSGLLLIEVLQGSIPVGMAWITKQIFDLLAQDLQSGVTATPWQSLVFLLVGYVLLGVISQTLQAVNAYLNSELNRQLTLDIHLTVNGKINSLAGLAPFENPQLYNTIQLAVQGAQMGPQQTVTMLTSFTQSIITLLGFLGILLAFDPFLAAMVALAALPQLFIQLKFGRQRFSMALENTPKERRANYYDYILSSLGFIKELRLFELADYFMQALRLIYKDIHQVQRKQQLYELRWQAVLNFISSLTAGGAFVIVILRAFAGLISLGSVTLYTNAVGSVQNALWGIFYSISTLNENAIFYAQFKALLALPQPIPVADTARPVPALSSQIELRNVSFRYSDQQPWILRDVNLTIGAGECLALVGLNGAGKTTLVKLLTRLYDPVEGQIYWDGIDIREFDPKDLHRHMAAIFQDFVHFDLTAYENIALGDLMRFNDAQLVQQSAIKAGIHEVIQGLPQEYQTILSRSLAEDGNGLDLSGGEWQKIALARMFMRPADLLILDEPTAALDVQSEHDVYSRFVELIAGKTSILISHRFSTVRMANKIAVLSDGIIVETGSHDELLAADGVYARMYNLQAEKYR